SAGKPRACCSRASRETAAACRRGCLTSDFVSSSAGPRSNGIARFRRAGAGRHFRLRVERRGRRYRHLSPDRWRRAAAAASRQGGESRHADGGQPRPALSVRIDSLQAVFGDDLCNRCRERRIACHFVLSPDNRFLYALNELLGTVTTFALDAKTGLLSELGSVSGLPPESKLVPGAPRGAPGAPGAAAPRNTDNDVWAADIHVTPNG